MNTSIISKIRTFLYWYFLTWVGLVIILFVFVFTRDAIQPDRVWEMFGMALKSLLTSVTLYFLVLIPYLLFVIIRSIVNDFKEKGWLGLGKGITLKTVTPVILIWASLQIIDEYRHGEKFDYQWNYSVENKGDSIRNQYSVDGKQRGIHVMNLQSDTLDLDILKTNNFEWITLVPFVSQEKYDTPSLRTTVDLKDSSKRWERWKKLKGYTDRYGFKVMIKPHVWLTDRSGGLWRSKIQMTSEEDWATWFDQYGEYILAYARIAEHIGAEQFCIGTELNTSVVEQPTRWHKLIEKIRKVYSGKLTYGANWDDDLENNPLWDALDYIGIQAYFPIAKNSGPELKELEEGWKGHYPRLEKVSEKFDKPILFTEIGYKTTRDAGKEPWEWNTFSNRFYKRISKKTQALCYEAFFNTVWQQPWFAGAHIWEWQSRGTRDGMDNSFSLEGKPALNQVAKGFR